MAVFASEQHILLSRGKVFNLFIFRMIHIGDYLNELLCEQDVLGTTRYDSKFFNRD